MADRAMGFENNSFVWFQRYPVNGYAGVFYWKSWFRFDQETMKLECFVSHHEVDVFGVSGISVYTYGKSSNKYVSNTCLAKSFRRGLSSVDMSLRNVSN